MTAADRDWLAPAKEKLERASTDAAPYTVMLQAGESAALLAERAEAERDKLREALQRIADENYLRGNNDGWQGMCARQGRLARAALAAGGETP